MQPFSSAYPRCPKCDAPPGWIETVYCRGGEQNCPGEIGGEHLHKNCSRCGWEWMEETADAKEEPACRL